MSWFLKSIMAPIISGLVVACGTYFLPVAIHVKEIRYLIEGPHMLYNNEAGERLCFSRNCFQQDIFLYTIRVSNTGWTYCDDVQVVFFFDNAQNFSLINVSRGERYKFRNIDHKALDGNKVGEMINYGLLNPGDSIFIRIMASGAAKLYVEISTKGLNAKNDSRTVRWQLWIYILLTAVAGAIVGSLVAWYLAGRSRQGESPLVVEKQ